MCHKINYSQKLRSCILVVASEKEASYLTERSQYVKNTESKSETVSVTSGFPQGSLLIPLLLIIFVNDLPKRVKVCKTFGYADDFNFVTTQPSDIQSDLEVVNCLCEKDEIKLNDSKCCILLVQQQNKRNSKHHIELNSNFFVSKSEQKNLIVIMAAKLQESKQPKRFYFLKRNVSILANFRTKLNG